MKICLATIHAKPAFIPLALLYLKAYLVEKQKHEFGGIEILEFAKDSQEEDIVCRILANEPEVVGLSCYVWNVKKLMAVSRRIKELRPRSRIVLGGPEVGPVARSVLEAHPYVDVIVKSEGEIPFAEIIQAWGEGHSVAGVRGIYFRSDDKIIENQDAPILQNLNHLSSPHLPAYAEHKGRIVCIETQRGCVFRCNFCFYNKDLSIRNRRFDLDRVKHEILFWLQQDVQEIYLMDPVFNLNSARAKEICRFVIEHNHRNVKFHAEVWAEFIDEELARLFQEANFHFLEVGLQTTDDMTLATVERRLRLKPFLEGIRHLRKYNLKFELQLIYGLPGETVASFKKSLNFANALEPYYLAVFPLMVLPGTELWKKAGMLNLNFEPEPPYFIRSHGSMTPEDIDYGWKIVDALKWIGNSRTIRVLSKESGVTFAGVLEEWIIWQQEQPGAVAARNADGIKEFVLRFCDIRRIPTQFYRAFASLEFREPAINRA